MRHLYASIRDQIRTLILLISLGLMPDLLAAQQLKITDFSLFGGSSGCSSCSVQVGYGSKILGGSVGSYNLVKSGSSVRFAGNINSGGTIQFANSDTVSAVSLQPILLL